MSSFHEIGIAKGFTGPEVGDILGTMSQIMVYGRSRGPDGSWFLGAIPALLEPAVRCCE